MQKKVITTRRHFLKTSSVMTSAALAGTLSWDRQVHANSAKQWKVAIVMDTTNPKARGHGLHLAYRGLPNVEVVAHVDGNTNDVEKKLVMTHAKRFYPSVETMLEKETPDIVVLDSRLPGDHLVPIRQVSAKGCHIYCEKPLTAFLHEADEIVKIAEEKKIKIAMAHPCRNALGFVTMKRLVDSGKIGTPLTIHGWGKCDHRGGGEDLMVLGTHILDLMLFFFGQPQRITSDIRNEGRPALTTELTKTVEPIGPAIGDEIYAVFRFPNAVQGTFESRRGLYTGATHRMGICVTGSKGMLTLRFPEGQTESPLRFSNAPCAPDGETFHEVIELKEDRVISGAEPMESSIPGPIYVKAGRFAFWDLMQSIIEDRQPITNVYDARMVAEMIYGVYASHLAGRPVDFPLTDRSHPLARFDSLTSNHPTV